jgi:hypothetical protein
MCILYGAYFGAYDISPLYVFEAPTLCGVSASSTNHYNRAIKNILSYLKHFYDEKHHNEAAQRAPFVRGDQFMVLGDLTYCHTSSVVSMLTEAYVGCV